MSNYHALLSPSGANKWVNCPNSVTAEFGQPDVGDVKFRDLGTAKHSDMEYCLKNDIDSKDPDVQIVVQGVRDVIWAYKQESADVLMFLEQSLPIGYVTGETNATGSADVVLVVTWADNRSEICIIDAKYGYKEVDPEENLQLMMYGLGAIRKFEYEADFQTVRLMIAQPLVKEAFSEWSLDAYDLNRWADTVFTPAAGKALLIYANRGNELKLEDYNPGEKQCQWCKAKAVCVSRAVKVQAVLGEDFDRIADVVTVDLLKIEHLGEVWQHLDFIEGWCKDVRTRVQHEMLEGVAVKGLKLVQSRQGNRAWESEVEVEKLLKTFRVRQSEMYSFKLLGPSHVLKAVEHSPKKYKALEAMVTRKDGGLTVCLEADKRAGVQVTFVKDEFDDLTGMDLI